MRPTVESGLFLPTSPVCTTCVPSELGANHKPKHATPTRHARRAWRKPQAPPAASHTHTLVCSCSSHTGGRQGVPSGLHPAGFSSGETQGRKFSFLSYSPHTVPAFRPRLTVLTKSISLEMMPEASPTAAGRAGGEGGMGRSRKGWNGSEGWVVIFGQGEGRPVQRQRRRRRHQQHRPCHSSSSSIKRQMTPSTHTWGRWRA